MKRSFLLCVIHLALVGSVGGKFLWDRARLPRCWVRAAPYEPGMPRGRYVSLQLEVDASALPEAGGNPQMGYARLEARGGRLTALPATYLNGMPVSSQNGVTRLARPVAFFISEHAADPRRRPSDEELWVEVSVPKKGPPRPIALAVKKGGVLRPIEAR